MTLELWRSNGERPGFSLGVIYDDRSACHGTLSRRSTVSAAIYRYFQNVAGTYAARLSANRRHVAKTAALAKTMLANFTFGTWESVCFVKICGVTIESHPASSEPLAAGQPGHAAIDYDYPGTDSGIDSRPVLRIPARRGATRVCALYAHRVHS